MTSTSVSFRDDFQRLVARAPRHVAVIDEASERSFTYADLAALLVRYIGFFEIDGRRRIRHVLSLLPNSVECLATFLATMHYGLRFAPIAPEVTPRELVSWVELIQPDLALVHDTTSEELCEALVRLGIKVHKVALDARFEWLPDGPAMSRESSEHMPGQLCVTTSGSTGDPKALLFDTDRLWASGRAFVGHHGFLDADARFLNILPMSYLGGLFNLGLIPLAVGGSVVITETFSGKIFLDFWQKVERFEVTVLWLVPTIVRGLLRLSERTGKRAPCPRVQAAFLGTAPMDLESKLRFEEVFAVPLLENFALSETTFFSSETLDTRHRRCQGSVGAFLPYAEARFRPICEDDAIAGAAEILVKTPFLFLGYLRSGGEVDLSLTSDGFFATGDLGHLAEPGDLVVDGRLRDIVKRGGYLVSLQEIESLAVQHPAVAEAAAVPIPHEFYGESLQLFLVLRDPAEERSALEAVSLWLRENLVRHKWPERIEALAGLPRTASGKIRKGELARRLRSAAA